MITCDRIAEAIFLEIRERPYRVATHPNVRAENCAYKGMELIERLTMLGYGMRGCVGEINWQDGPYPEDVKALISDEVKDTHFYPEIHINGQWKILDPSMNSRFSKEYGFPLSEFGADNVSCFKITKTYDLEEQAQYIHKWFTDNDYANIFWKKGRPFFVALNQWLEHVNP